MASTQILQPKKVVAPYDAERFALRAHRDGIGLGDIVFVGETRAAWIVSDITNLHNEGGYTALGTSGGSAAWGGITGTLANQTDLVAALALKASLLTPTAVKTSAYSAVAGDLVTVDTTSGGVTVTLPTAPADKTVVAVKQIQRGGTNVVTVNTGGSDVFNRAGGPTTLSLTLLGQSSILQYAASTGIWYIISDDLPYGSLLGNANSWTGQQSFVAPVLGTPASVTLTNGTGLPVAGITGLGTGVGAWLATPSSANLLTAMSDKSGTGLLVFNTSPSLTTPSLGVATATSINGNIFTAGTYTLTGTAAKTLTFTNSITLTGTDATVMTFPTTSATIARTDAANTFGGTQTFGTLVATTINGNTFTAGSSTYTGTAGQTYTFPTTTASIARTDAANTFTGVQTMTSPATTTSITTSSVSFTAWAGATTLLTIGGTGASASMFMPSTLDATSSITGAIRTSGGISAAKAIFAGTSIVSISPTAGIGYATGAGLTVTQATSRTTGVSINAVCGWITTNTTSLAAGALASFTVTNTAVGINDTIRLSIRSGQTNKDSIVEVSAVAAGSFEITLKNTNGSVAEVGAIIINFCVIKGVIS